MTRQLVFVHGRAQQGKNAGLLKQEWIEAWKSGLAKTGLTLPISEDLIRFPYYGDTLDQLVGGEGFEQVFLRARLQPGLNLRFLSFG